MGPFASRWWLQTLAWIVTIVIMALNAKLVYEQVSEWMVGAGAWGWLIGLFCVPPSLALVGLLLWMIFRREKPLREEPEVSAEDVAAHAARTPRQFRRIGVALDVRSSDAAMLAEAVALATIHRAELVLIHVVDGVGGTWYGAQTGDLESRDDQAYLDTLAARLRTELQGQGVPAVETVLGYGDPSTEIVEISRAKHLDLMVLGGHGHRGLRDLVYGQTITTVRHGLDIPVVAVRG
jgi:manganese transport protein